jgi:hypothetical protein
MERENPNLVNLLVGQAPEEPTEHFGSSVNMFSDMVLWIRNQDLFG